MAADRSLWAELVEIPVQVSTFVTGGVEKRVFLKGALPKKKKKKNAL